MLYFYIPKDAIVLQISGMPAQLKRDGVDLETPQQNKKSKRSDSNPEKIPWTLPK